MSTQRDYRNRPKPIKYGWLIECVLIGFCVLAMMLEVTR